MSKSGQSNYRGVNSQAKAAILLFLINFYEGDFNALTLEDDSWEDFTLSFQSGKKIIAEAKAWQKTLTLNDVVNILQGIVPKSDNLNPGDEILIVCNSVDPTISKSIEYLRYDLAVAEIPGLKVYRKPEKLTPTIIELLKKTKFYKLPTSDTQSADDFLFDETVVRLYRILPMWLPQYEIERLMSHILKEKVYDKSERGDTLTKTEFIQYLEEYKRTKISEAGAYDSDKQKVTKQVERIISAVNDKDERHLIEGGNLISLSAQPMKMYILLDLISRSKQLELSRWDTIWRALINRSYTYRVIGIFEDNLEDIENAKYVLSFFELSIPELTSLSMERNSRDHSLSLISNAIGLHPEIAAEALSFIASYLKPRANAYKKSFSKRDLSYEKENVAKILVGIYDVAVKQKDNITKQRIVDLIADHFNLSDDDGEYLSTTPAEIYGLVRRWLKQDFYGRLTHVVSMIVSDFNESEFYSRGFSGWELMGGMESGWSNTYKIHDRGFMEQILTPTFNRVYKADGNKLWNYIRSDVVTLSVGEVSALKPDFLSRAVIPVVVNEYLNGQHSDEAFKILTKFLKLNKGLPDRGRLIFQLLRGSIETTDGKIWKLTKAYLAMSKTKLPQSVFVEDVVLGLATKGDKEAIGCIREWMNNPAYIDTENRWHFYVDAVIGKLLASGNIDAQKSGVEFLKKYLTPAGKWEDGDNTRAWDITPLLEKTLVFDRDELAALVIGLYQEQETLTKNRQLVITSLLAQPEIKDKDDVRFIYEAIVKPIIFDDLHGDINKIAKRFSNHHSRQNFMQFAEKLMQINKLDEGMALVRIFINDPDPMLTNYADDPDGTFNYHRKIAEGKEEIVITTVRGWTPFVLQKVVKVSGKQYLSEVVDMTDRLLNDPNYYVRFQALILLSGLAQNRHTVVPPAREKRFMTLKDAKRIENIAFAFLENEENRSIKPLMERTLYCFNYLRSLNEKNAKRLMLSARKLDFSEEIDHLSSLYLYFAEFRKESFIDKESVKIFGQTLFDDLSNFDDTFFKQLLEDEVVTGGSEMRRHLAWQFWRLIGDKAGREDYQDMFDISYKYLTLMTERYDHSAFEMLFHFIDDNLEKRATDCLKLWKAAIISEKEFLAQNENSLVYHQDWWDRLNTAEIVLKIRQEEGNDEFLKYVNELLSYPQKFQGVHNAKDILDTLKTIDSAQARQLVDTFNENYPHLYAQDRTNEVS